MLNTKDLPQHNIYTAFTDKWKIRTSAKSILHLISHSEGLYAAVNINDSQVFRQIKKIDGDLILDLIIGDFPLNTEPNELENRGEKSIVKRKWGEILKYLLFLGNMGTAFFFFEPFVFTTYGKKIERELNKNGLYISAIFNTPEVGVTFFL